LTSNRVEQELNLKKAAPTMVLIALFASSIFFTFNPIGKGSPDFYVGVEFAYSNNLNNSQTIFNDLKSLVDKVENYTNLFVIGLPEVSKNQALLNKSCDYVYAAGLHFIVLFIDITTYNYTVSDWTKMAQQKYGDQFLGVYRLDEPGGSELDNYKDRFLNKSNFSPDQRNYTKAANEYLDVLGTHVKYFRQLLYPTLFTADYGLYWFDYQIGYNVIMAEFGWNNSRQIATGLCRGAAAVQNRQWGTIITWTYTQEPYIEPASQLYDDLVLTYKAGATYAVIFNYPENVTSYGILTDLHFEAIQNFWKYINNNPQNLVVEKANYAYVLPQDYGFGFRNANDTIWGLWSSDELSSRVWSDANRLTNQYGFGLDIVYNDPQYRNDIASRYDKLFFWNETIN
jgi:hypothetical protein